MKDKDIHKKALERFDRAKEYYKDDYSRGEEDEHFLFESAWDEGDRAEREREGRPCLEEDHLMPFVHQVINDIRQSRPAIRVSPVDSGADVDTAEVLKGMIRSIEDVSGADTVYDTAAENAVQSSVGWIRVHVDYANNENFDQEIQLKRIRNPRSVMIDPSHEVMDGSDAQWGFVYDDIEKEEFEEQYPDASPVSFENFAEDGWCQSSGDKEYVRVAEYFYYECEDKNIVMGQDGQIYLAGEYDGHPLAERTIEVKTLKWCKLSGAEILEERTWPGQYIPLIPVYGREYWCNGKRRYMSLIHKAKDPQKRLNFWLSTSTEIIALQTKSPYKGLNGQFETHKTRWQNANTENFAYLEFDPVTLEDGQVYAIAPQREPPPMGSAAVFQEMMAAAEGIKNVLGMFNASIGQDGNEKSGRAILARQAEGDNATFHFVDNLATAIRHTGRVIVDLIPKIYSGPRIVRILGEDGTEKSVPINQPFIEQNGEKVPSEKIINGITGMYDLEAGKYDVTVSVGPSYATKRQEAVNSILEISRANPRIIEVAGDILMKNLDIPYAEDIAKRLEILLPPELRQGDPEQQQMALAQQAIEQLKAQLMQMEQALTSKKADEDLKREIEMRKLQLDEVKVQIDLMKAQAEINQQIPAEAMNDIASALKDLDSRVQDASEALDIIMGDPPDEIPARDGVPSEAPQEPPSGGFFTRIFGR